jgi:hypothetical protein
MDAIHDEALQIVATELQDIRLAKVQAVKDEEYDTAVELKARQTELQQFLQNEIEDTMREKSKAVEEERYVVLHLLLSTLPCHIFCMVPTCPPHLQL